MVDFLGKPRIAIVGGGPGGLMTAYLLARKSFEKHKITLFEATERVGGKIVSAEFDSAPVLYEAGVAELYDYSQLGTDPLRQLVNMLGLPTVKMFGQTIVLGNRIMRNAGDIKRHFGRKTLDAITDFRKRGSSSLSRRDYYDAGWPDDNKHKWADRSFQSVLSKIPDDNARRFLKVAVHSDLAIEPHSTSALYGMENCLMDDPRYMQYYSIKGGIERLPRALQASISADIRLNSPVKRVEKTATGTYRVFTRNNGSLEPDEFDLVAVALPNYWLPTIEWGGKRLETAIYKHHAYYDSPAHYLRISLLFKSPFWRKLISDHYFQIDAFGGCCVYDEGARYDANPYGVLNWLLGGNDALIMSNYEDSILINKALESLPVSLAAGRDLFMEGRIHRWVGTVCAQPGGYPIKGPKIRHLPDPEGHPGLILVGDYLFDSTINGVLDSADIATDLMLKYLEKRKQVRPAHVASDENLEKSYFDYYDGKRSYEESFKEYFDEQYVIDLIRIAWGAKPPYRLLDGGSANGLSLAALGKAGVDAWGVENNRYIHKRTPGKLRDRNILGDVRDLPFTDNYFDFVYETCLCYVPNDGVDAAIRELYRVTRRGIVFGSVTADANPRLVKKQDLFFGVKTLATMEEWSNRFLSNGFRLAVNDPRLLTKVWKVELKANEGKTWYPSEKSMRYCFYTKEDVSPPLT